MFSSRIAALSGALLALGACAQSDATPAPRGLEINVAALNLPGVGKVCFDLTVYNAAGGAAGGGQVVWSRGTPGPNGNAASGAVCSDTYGNSSGGDITFVGTCDADGAGGASSRMNSVTLWIDGLYDDSAANAYIDPASSQGWQNPCSTASGGCTLDVVCEENTDKLVAFDLTVMRQANQGFFDVAVNFADIFCSAKFDTCTGSTPMDLLYGGDTTRDWTGVFGFACTAGPGADVATNLLYGKVQVTCGDTVFTLDPKVAAGNASVVAGSPAHTVNYGVYRGSEALACGAGSCNKLYWNLAIDLADLAGLGACTLSLQATANDGDIGFAGGVPTAAGQAWPYIDVALDLTKAQTQGGAVQPFCQAHALNAVGSRVKTVYRGSLVGAAAPVMCSAYAGAAAHTTAGLTCDDPCDNQQRIINGDVAVSNAAGLAALACVETITGSLTLSGPAVITLPRLVTVGHDLVIQGGGVAQVSLPELHTTGVLFAYQTSGLTSFAAPKLQRATGYGTQDGNLVFGLCTALTSLSLPELVDIEGFLGVWNSALTTFTLPKLTRVPRMYLDSNYLLTELRFPVLKNVTATPAYIANGTANGIQITLDTVLTRLDMPLLEVVNGPLTLDHLGALQVDFTSLTETGAFAITYTSLASATFPVLARVVASPLIVGSNPSLTSLTFPNLRSFPSGGEVTILDNALDDCALRAVIIAGLGSSRPGTCN